MSVVLIGYRGSGKSVVGRKLADRLWHTFVDTDEVIMKRAGKTIRDIFEQEGERHFRDLEMQAVREVCGLSDTVIALGGGAVEREENRQALTASGYDIIYLRCEPAELLRRVEADRASAEARPRLTSLAGIDEIQQVLARREPLYRGLMRAELDVTKLTPAEAAQRVAELL